MFSITTRVIQSFLQSFDWKRGSGWGHQNWSKGQGRRIWSNRKWWHIQQIFFKIRWFQRKVHSQMSSQRRWWHKFHYTKKWNQINLKINSWLKILSSGKLKYTVSSDLLNLSQISSSVLISSVLSDPGIRFHLIHGRL